MATIASLAASTPSATAGTSTANAATSGQEQQDRFLKLLVAQLNNQDPMNPLDNAQMTSQMAQINTVTGISQLNETMKSLASQFTALQVMQGTGMIGHDILLDSNTLSIDAGKAKGAVQLSGYADKVQVQVLSAGGELLDTVALGAQGPGLHAFEWDASGYRGSSSPVFKVVASAGKTAVAAQGMARDTVTAISNDSDGMHLQLKGRAAIAYDAVKGVL